MVVYACRDLLSTLNYSPTLSKKRRRISATELDTIRHHPISMQWAEDDGWVYGRRYGTIRTGWGCFAKTRWVPMDEYYRARSSRGVRSFFRLLAIVPVPREPQIHYILFDPWDPWYYGGGWGAPLPFPHGGGDWGFWPPGFGGRAGRRRGLEDIYAHIGDQAVAEDIQEWDDWRTTRHRDNVARIDEEINEIVDRPQGYLEELMRGWQDGGDLFDDNPDRRRLRRLWREIGELQQERDRFEREDLQRYRREREERRLGRLFARQHRHGRHGDGYYHDRYR